MSLDGSQRRLNGSRSGDEPPVRSQKKLHLKKRKVGEYSRKIKWKLRWKWTQACHKQRVLK